MSQAPLATYRLQLTREFGFDRAAEAVPYLAELGISHVYLSPCWEARPGSEHGYDVVDPTRPRQDFGGKTAAERLFAALAEHGLGAVLDIVPNHVAADPIHNRWWRDILRFGQASRYRDYFDISWERGNGRVVLPILGVRYAEALGQGVVRLVKSEATISLRVYEEGLPLSPETERELLDGEGSGDERLERLNQAPQALDALLERQHYKLSFWRSGLGELNYRRFFDVSSLVGVRVEVPEVFEATHALLRRWVDAGWIDGVRIDHPDGLADPEGYFRRLRECVGDHWVVVEKILEAGETLPETWPVAGTTGYDFLNAVLRLFIDPAGETPLTRTYRELCGLDDYDFSALVREKKRIVLRRLFRAELGALSELGTKRLRGRWQGRDVNTNEVKAALGELIVELPVYRLYLRDDVPASEQDVKRLGGAVARAGKRNPRLGFVLGLLEQELLDTSTAAGRLFRTRFAQLTGPTMAKGLEDTALYSDARLIALNEVGGDPARFGCTVAQFHEYCGRIQRQFPNTMLSTSTHDTKRSEDVRIRIALLSELPDLWEPLAARWLERVPRWASGKPIDAVTAYFLLQTLVGTWPITLERLEGYMLKAAREAKGWTSWREPNERAEARLRAALAGLYEDDEFLAELDEFRSKLEPHFIRNSLAQVLLKLTCPGVPDLYQGTELFDLSLADPDNRRPVDFEARQRKLDVLRQDTTSALTRDPRLSKLWCVHRALEVRQSHRDCFGPEGSYEPLSVSGNAAERVVAFARGERVVCVVPRLGVKADFAGTCVQLPEPVESYRNAFTGEAASSDVVTLWQRFPVALLTRN